MMPITSETSSPNWSKKNHRKIILNFRDIEYIDSVGTGVLVQCYKAMNDIGGIVVLSECSKWVKKTAHIMNLERVIPIFTSVSQAKDFINSKTQKPAEENT